jgi:prevent-host-death family protein
MRVREVIPISELRKRQAEVLAALEKGPAILNQHGKGAAVLLSLDAYNRLLEELEDLQDRAGRRRSASGPWRADQP